MENKILAGLVILLMTFGLAGCGNNGGGGQENVQPVAIPVKPTYKVIPVEGGAHALTHNEKGLVYGTVDGLMYQLDVNTGISTFIYDLNNNIPQLLIGSLAYIGGSQYYYGAAHNASIRKLDISTGAETVVIADIFPDGMDFFRGKIYSVIDDRDERLAVFDSNGNALGILKTGIDDFVAITHSNKYLYILSEDGDVYQTDPDTGESILVVDNSGFQEGDSFGGVEGIDVFKNHIYLSNVDDSSIYRIELDIRAIE